MRRTGPSRRERQAATLLVVAALVAIGACESTPQSLPEPPAPDTTGMEPAVARLLESTRRNVRENPRDAGAWGRLGAVFQAHGLHADAAGCYRNAGRLAPEAFRWAYLLATVRDRSGAGPDELLELYTGAARLRGDYAPLHARLGLALFRNGRYPRAHRAFVEALEHDPELDLARRALGQVLLAQGDVDGALDQLIRVAERHPDDAAVQAALARAYTAAGDPQRAATAARAARARPSLVLTDPLLDEQVTALGASDRHAFARARRHIAAGAFAAAIDELERVRLNRTGDADVSYLLAVAHRGMGRLAEAQAQLQTALDLRSDHVPARLELARLLESQGRLGAALEQFERAAASSPRDPSILAETARVQVARDDLDGLVGTYAALVRLLPDDPRVRLNLGTALLRQGKLDDAVAALRHALALDPRNADTHSRLGVALEQLERGAESRDPSRADDGRL